ncbi:MAG: protein-tyrosine-phosphatase [Pirellulales bacterium]
MNRSAFSSSLLHYLQACETEFPWIPETRCRELNQVSQYIRDQHNAGKTARLTFICTHNSRRSHISQIWAQVASYYYGIPEVISYSGGTEATAFNPRAVTAMRKTGLRIVADDPAASNPRYRVCVGDTDTGFECFSKVFHEPPNPTNGYCAVMTCSQADDACPVVMGCDLRVPIRYEDPKVADDTPQESERYEERVRQIGREMLWMLKHSS